MEMWKQILSQQTLNSFFRANCNDPPVIVPEVAAAERRLFERHISQRLSGDSHGWKDHRESRYAKFS